MSFCNNFPEGNLRGAGGDEAVCNVTSARESRASEELQMDWQCPEVPRSKDVARAISVGLSSYGTPTAAAMSPYGTDAMSPLSPGSSYGTAPTPPEALDAEEGGVAASEAISDG